jgi:hypothetical protein
MAFPSRLKPATRAMAKFAGVISPTGIGVLLSVGAHAALWAASPQTSFSFAALSQAAQEANAEEAIVPITQLSPAERSRLPSFAQPRGLSSSPTGLTSLPLPSGLPFIAPKPNTLARRQVPANPMPSATTRTPTAGNLGGLGRTIPFNFSTVPTPARSASSQAPGVPLVNLPAVPPSSGATNPGTNNSPDPNGDLPDLAAGPDTAPVDGSANGSVDGSGNGPGNGPGIDTATALEGTEAAGTGNSQNQPTIPPGTSPEKEPAKEPGIQIPVGPAGDDGAIAQNEAPLIASSNVFDETNVSEADAEQNLAKWLAGKDNVLRGTSEITINSEFTACRENPPVDGLLGVVVNPDGSQEGAVVLKSTGYEMLNNLALTTLGYEAFGPLEAPTHYEIAVKVINEQAGCVGEEVVPEIPTE